MNCFYCGAEIFDHEETCPLCGANINAYKIVLYKAEAFYNEGLEKATVRDISGAIESLKESLRYNKSHTAARNLLGLCYFEIGETVQALREWVISKNLQPDNNIADEYLSKLQNAPGTLQKLDSAIKKYNQALEYAKEGSHDLAKIQLRRILGSNPKHVRAHQLLALLCIRDGSLEEAKKELNIVNKIDVKNTTTLRYMQEVKDIIKNRDANKKKKKKKDDTIVFQDGNDSIVIPKRSIGGLIDSALPSVINIVIGAIGGGLLCFFLLFPAYRDTVVKKNSEALISVNTDNVANTNNIEALRAQVDDLTASLSKYEGKENLSESYNHVLKAQALFAQGDLEGAYKEVENVNAELLEGDAATCYLMITVGYKDKEASEKYQDAYNAYRIKDLEKAYDGFLTVLELNEKCEDGLALYYMADICTEMQKFEEGIKYCERYLELYPDGRFVKDITKQLESLRKALEEGEVPSDTNTGTVNTGNTNTGNNAGNTNTRNTNTGNTNTGNNGNTTTRNNNNNGNTGGTGNTDTGNNDNSPADNGAGEDTGADTAGDGDGEGE